MYLVNLKSLLVYVLKQTFDAEFPQEDFRSLNVGIEYPVQPQGYPGIWVDYSDTAPLRQAGVAHRETDEDGVLLPATRFKFEGTASFTVVALTSRERDRLYDEVIRTLAFGAEDDGTSQFRTILEDNDLLAVNAKFDEIEVGGNAAAPGTPWGTDEIIYERTISLDLLGEFVADPVTNDLVLLSAITVTPIVDTDVGEPLAVVAGPSDGKGVWH